MSRTHKKTKGPGHEYWSRRFGRHGVSPGKIGKWLTKRHERAVQRMELFKARWGLDENYYA